MTGYYRVSLGKNAAYLADALANNYIGTGWLASIDLSDRLADDWREFNRAFIPVVQAMDSLPSKIGAGLACGQTWTLARGIEVGDIVLSPTGRKSYNVGKVISGYHYAAGTVLPHRREVAWFPEEIAREAMSPELSSSLQFYGTVQNLEHYAEELAALIKGDVADPVAGDPDVENPTFPLEKHLEDFLVSNWEKTELGRDYTIFSEDGQRAGRQYPTDTGPIDILAVSKDGTEVLVVELKRGRVSDVVVGQILRYMGFVAEMVPEKKVRGLIIGLEDDIRLRRALSMTQGIEFYRYEVSFKLHKG